jgi:hypothetical protein
MRQRRLRRSPLRRREPAAAVGGTGPRACSIARTSMKRIVLSIAVLLLIGFIGIWTRIAGDARPGIAPGAVSSTTPDPRKETNSSPAASESVDGASSRSSLTVEPSAQAAVPSTALKIVSSTGLALASIEIEIEPRVWQRRELAGGSCDLAGVRFPCAVRAPGHVAAVAESAGRTVVLEPDALLELDGEHLRECMLSIGPWQELVKNRQETGNSELARESVLEIAAFSTSGFVGDRRWLLAVNADRSGHWFPQDSVRVDLEWRDHRIAYIEFAAAHELRGRWDVPCDEVAETAPLDVVLVRPAGDRSGAIEATLSPLADVLESRTLTDFPWGKVLLNPPLQMYLKTHVPRDSDRVHWDGVPLRRQFIVRARDLDSGAFGCLAVDHDGSARTLTLHAGVVITGRVTVPAGAPRPARARCIWTEADHDPGKDTEWEGWSNVTFTEDGRFELRGWGNLPRRVEECNEFPARLMLQIDSAGCARSVTTHAIDPSGRCECGDIPLEVRAPQFVLAPGHGTPDDPLQHAAIRVSTKPEWSFIDVWGRSLPDGSFALYLEVDSVEHPDLFSAWSWKDGSFGSVPLSASSDEAIQALVLDRNNKDGFAFERAHDGRYERVRERDYAIDVECTASPREGKAWTFGWSWLGMAQRADALGADAVGERRVVKFRAPESGVTLWWSGGESRSSPSISGSEGGSIDLSAGAVTLKVP